MHDFAVISSAQQFVLVCVPQITTVIHQLFMCVWHRTHRHIQLLVCVLCICPQWHIHLFVCVLCITTVANSPVGMCTMQNGSGTFTCWCVCCICPQWHIHLLVCALCTTAVAYSPVGVCAINRYMYCVCPQWHIHLLVCVLCTMAVAHSSVGVCAVYVHSGTFICWYVYYA